MLITLKDLEDLKSSKDIYALVGFPIKHSMSHFIHKKLFGGDEHNAWYVLIEVNPLELEQCVSLLKTKVKGFNVTIPYKESIKKYLDEMDEKSTVFGAVNTVVVKNGKLKGYNTDCEGFKSSLQKEGIVLKGQKALILGAGGVSKMMAFEAAFEGADITIAVREDDVEQAKELSQKIKAGVKDAKVSTMLLDDAKSGYDLIFNGTPVGMNSNGVSPIGEDVLKGAKAVFDAIYNPIKTQLLKLAEKNNIKAINGLNMLVYQAAASQSIWSKRKFDKELIGQICDLTSAYLNLNHQNIILSGFMGSGKSTIGREIAKRLEYNFIDMDMEIELREDMSISKIFEKHGEEYFRNIEKEFCEEFKTKSKSVIASGGGVVLNPQNIDYLKQGGQIFYLNANENTIKERLEGDSSRPLLSHNKEEKIHKLFEERKPIYESTADYVISADGSVEEIADNIIKTILNKGDLN